MNLPKDTLQLKLTFLVLMTAAISEVVGTHATLGAFLAGVALGRIPDTRKLAHESMALATSMLIKRGGYQTLARPRPGAA